MAVFTTVSKNQLNWQAVTPSPGPFFLNIGSGYNLLIATGYRLIIQRGVEGSDWTNTSKYS